MTRRTGRSAWRYRDSPYLWTAANSAALIAVLDLYRGRRRGAAGMHSPGAALLAAHRAAVARMPEGMAALDTRWRIVSLNPALAALLAAPPDRVRGEPVEVFLPALRGLARPGRGAGPETLEFSIGTGLQARDYAAYVSPLRDPRARVIGHLLLLQDITERTQAKARALAQQWVQATLQERELLAHELHDGLSQGLTFLNLQAQAVEIYLQAGQRAAAEAGLASLVKASAELQEDVRDLIGQLLAVDRPFEDFCSALCQALTHFEDQTGQHVNLELQSEVDAICNPNILPSTTWVQLLRIIQEALVNVRKHAGAISQVAVRLRVEAESIYLAVEDDGAGFDLARPPQGHHFGLQVMRQRVAYIGGELAVYAAPGRGVRIEVRLPTAAGPDADDEQGGAHEDPVS